MKFYREIKLMFEPRDLWVGVYWKRWPQAIAFYVCIVPMLPIYIYVQWYPQEPRHAAE